MMASVPDILARIVSEKRRDLPAVRKQLPLLEQQAEARRSERRSFRNALLAEPPSIIAEIKKASPSKGLLSTDFQPASLAGEYENGGAAALSVLTDEAHFQGRLADLEAARAAVRLPVLRKDFTTDDAHIIQAAAHGADAILLIAAVLTTRELRKLRETAARYSLDALVEVHNAGELECAVASGAELIGVNNRNLHTFAVDLNTSFDLSDILPTGVVRISESGIESADQVRRLSDVGYHAFLVGEHLVRSGSPASAIQALRS